MKWKKVSAKRYMEMLEILWLAEWNAKGFLVGEPWRHRICEVTGKPDQPAFAPFVKLDRGYYEGSGPMTIAEFRALELRDVGRVAS